MVRNLAIAVFLVAPFVLVPIALNAQDDEAASSQRVLAPGVLRVIPSDGQPAETFTGPIPFVEVVIGKAGALDPANPNGSKLQWTPQLWPKSDTIFERAKTIILRRDVWNLEFAFKPMRMIEVDVPQPTGKMQRKVIWYMVYRVRYLGSDLNPQAAEDDWGHKKFGIGQVNYEGRFFFPHFVLKSHEFNKSYLDRVIPAAMKPIAKREQPDGPLHNSVQITRQAIPFSGEEAEKGVWGVVTWEDVDPRIDYFSVYIRGLTNAYKPVDPPDIFKAGDPPGTGRQLLGKTLRLNFWRPGDHIRETEDEIRFGVPVEPELEDQQEILGAYGMLKRLDYLWIYQ